MPQQEVRFRLLRDDDRPATNPNNLSYQFGLQDTKGNITPGTKQPNGALAFDFTLTVKPGKQEQPVFTGPHASGAADDRFVYLSWWSKEQGSYINRVKARLQSIDWKLIEASKAENRPITTNVTGRGPGDGMKPITWYLG